MLTPALCIPVPVDTTTIKTLYVFVEISVDRAHLAASIRLNFPHCIPSPTSSIGSAKGKGPELEIEIEPSSAPAPSTAAPDAQAPAKPTKLAVVGTIQFVAAVQGLKVDLEAELPKEEEVERLAIEAAPGSEVVSHEQARVVKAAKPKFSVDVPQVKPLSPGEILGCTAPRLAPDTEALMYAQSRASIKLTADSPSSLAATSATVASISNPS